jgi:hypothetical protein
VKTEGDPSIYYLFENRTFHVCFWLVERGVKTSLFAFYIGQYFLYSFFSSYQTAVYRLQKKFDPLHHAKNGLAP